MQLSMHDDPTNGPIGTTDGLLREIRDALFGSNRAFVFVKNIDAQFIGQKSTHTITKWRFVAHWENGGNTPTKNMRNRFNYTLFKEPVDLGFQFSDVGDQPNGPTMIGPRAVMHSSFIDIPVDDLQKLKDGDAHAYLWGWADYNDIFPNTGRHRSEFCVKIVVHGDVLTEKCQFLFQQHERFNGFHEECMRSPAPYSPRGYYKFLDTPDIDKVIGDVGTVKISSVSYFRTLEASRGTIADPLEAASLLTVGEKFVLTEGSPELEIANNAGIGLGMFQKFADVSSGGVVDISGLKLMHTTQELFLYSASVGDLDQLTLDMCVNADPPYDACLRIADLGALRQRIFEAGRIRELDCKVSDLFEPGLIQQIEYEEGTRDIREGPVIEPSPFKKDVRFKHQSEVRILFVPKDGAEIPNKPLIIEIPDPKFIFKEVFRNYRSDDMRSSRKT
jgi:hypothetical protein